MRYVLLILALTITSSTLVAQKKKVIYQDTVGRTIDVIDYLSILNSGWYRAQIDNTDPKVRVVDFARNSQHQYDSLKNRTKERTVKTEKLNQPSIPFSVKDLNGNFYDSDQLKGKIVVVNYWLVGCTGCEVEAPELNALYAKYNENPRVVFVSFARSAEGKVKKFLVKKPFAYPVVILEDELAKQFNVSSFPTNQVIDVSGKYAFYSSGVGAGSVHLIDEAIELALK